MVFITFARSVTSICDLMSKSLGDSVFSICTSYPFPLNRDALARSLPQAWRVIQQDSMKALVCSIRR
jgi:hypothetical protein